MVAIDSSTATLAIIAGGRATRLGGRLKPLIDVSGQSVLSRLVALVPPEVPRLLVTNTPEAFVDFAGTRVRDRVAGAGPPGGVVTALESATTPWVLVVAGDMPFVTAADAQRLAFAIDDTVEIVVAERDGHLEPLFGLYRRALAAPFAAALDAGPSMRALVSARRFQRVSFDPRVLDSLNTPDDLARLGAK